LFKTLGDAGLAAFPSELADAAVLAFQAVRREGDNWLAQNGYKSRAIVKLHLGPVAIGLVGSPGEEILDLYGKTVNVAATLTSTGLGMTPAVFRRLSAVSHKSFKKHTRQSAISTPRILDQQPC
jgi:class 3 adenylate cyclase